jgi:hypothetical protein
VDVGLRPLCHLGPQQLGIRALAIARKRPS